MQDYNKVLKVKQSPKILYDKGLGFGEPGNSLVMDPEARKEDKKAERKINYIGRYTKNFFSFKQ